MHRRYWKLADGRIGTVTSLLIGSVDIYVYFVFAPDFDSLRRTLQYIKLLQFLDEKKLRASTDDVFKNFRVVFLGLGDEETLIGQEFFQYIIKRLGANEIGPKGIPKDF